MLGLAPIYDVDVKRFDEKWRQKHVVTSKTDVSKTTWRHARESSYTLRWHFLAPVGFEEIRVGYARNISV